MLAARGEKVQRVKLRVADAAPHPQPEGAAVAPSGAAHGSTAPAPHPAARTPRMGGGTRRVRLVRGEGRDVSG